MPTETTADVLMVALSLGDKGAPPSEFRIFKAGMNKTRKGNFLFEEKDAKQVMAHAAEFEADFAIDYAHSMFSGGLFGSPGDPAETHAAAGWFKPELRNGELWAADVSWTEKAKTKLTAREFRYISPAFQKSEDGHISELLNVALTNIPATKGLTPLVASTTRTEENSMNPKLLALLGLSASASEDGVLEAVAKLSAKATGALATTVLALTSKATEAEALGVVMAWQASHGKIAELSAKVEASEKAVKATELKSLLDAAVKEGKVTPAQVEHLSVMPIETLKAFLSAAPIVVKSGKKLTEKPADGTQVALSDTDIAVAKLFGHDPKQVAALAAGMNFEVEEKTEDERKSA